MGFPSALPGVLSSFPPTVPNVEIARRDRRVAAVNCVELQWLQGIPRANDLTVKGFYSVETGDLDAVEELAVVGTASIHGVPCVEMQRRLFHSTEHWALGPSTLYCGIGSTKSEIFAVQEDGQAPYTFEDKGFAVNWGDVGDHRIVDAGHFDRVIDGGYRPPPTGKVFGAGTWDVRIGERMFTCMRAIEPGSDEHDETAEAYIDTASQRTVLYRQYRGAQMSYDKKQDHLERNPDVRFPESRKLVINRHVFVHCDCTGGIHDVITGTGLGLT